VNGRANIVHEARQGELSGSGSAANALFRFKNGYTAACLGHDDGGGQPVGPAAHYERGLRTPSIPHGSAARWHLVPLLASTMISTDAPALAKPDTCGYHTAMERERFEELMEESLRELPAMFREKVENLAIMVEDEPEDQARFLHGPRGGPRRLLLGIFQGVPATQKSVWDIVTAPNRIVLYQKNIEAICRNDDEIRAQVRKTVMHELGHYFGMSEEQLRQAGLG
jgi:predicted Zn-dependent protease with MMP-like domain